MSNKAEKVLAIMVGIVAVLAIGAGVVSGMRGTPRLTAGSPEATVQDYLTHVLDRDLQAAADELDPDGVCTSTDLENIAPQSVSRAVLRESTLLGDQATVRIDLVYEKSGGRFGGSWIEPLSFQLTRTNGRWVITGRPWPMFECGPRNMP